MPRSIGRGGGGRGGGGAARQPGLERWARTAVGLAEGAVFRGVRDTAEAGGRPGDGTGATAAGGGWLAGGSAPQRGGGCRRPTAAHRDGAEIQARGRQSTPGCGIAGGGRNVAEAPAVQRGGVLPVAVAAAENCSSADTLSLYISQHVKVTRVATIGVGGLRFRWDQSCTSASSPAGRGALPANQSPGTHASQISTIARAQGCCTVLALFSPWSTAHRSCDTHTAALTSRRCL